MSTRLTRRALLGGGISALGVAAWAEGPQTALRPVARPEARTGTEAQVGTPPPRPIERLRARPSSESLVAEAGLGGAVAYVLADARTGAVLDARQADVPLPPASVTKAVTALYALDALGTAHRFTTRVLATGPVTGGILEGDLILAGGADPTLSTDDLAVLASALRQGGLTEVRGAFRVWGGALPHVPEIEPGQLDHLSYNPAVSGLNLNFNRVHFEWARVTTASGADWRVTMDARTDLHRPEVTMARMRIADREVPVYTYADGGGVDDWTVARAALGDGGSRWLPVRFPPAYAGDVFRSMARANGIVLGAPVPLQALPAASELARHESPTLDVVLRDMLRFSTNLTAEAVGLSASAARGPMPPALGPSAALMRDWVGATFGADPLFADHSGLADTSRISTRDMVRILSGAQAGAGLPGLLRDIAMVDTRGNPVAAPPVNVVAKTGTLNFVSTLAGYARAASGRELVFAIFAADEGARLRAKASDEEVPTGVREYNAKAKALQQRLLQRWGTVFAA